MNNIFKYSVGTAIHQVPFPVDGTYYALETIEYILNISLNDHYSIKQLSREYSPRTNWKCEIFNIYHKRYENLIKEEIKRSRRHPEEGYILISDPFGDNLDSRQ